MNYNSYRRLNIALSYSYELSDFQIHDNQKQDGRCHVGRYKTPRELN